MARCLELFFCVRCHRRSGAGGGRRSLRRGVDLRSGGGTRRRGAPRPGSRGRGGRSRDRSQGSGGRSSNRRSRGSGSSGPITPVRRSCFLTRSCPREVTPVRNCPGISLMWVIRQHRCVGVGGICMRLTCQRCRGLRYLQAQLRLFSRGPRDSLWGRASTGGGTVVDPAGRTGPAGCISKAPPPRGGPGLSFSLGPSGDPIAGCKGM